MEENFDPVARTRANYYTPGSPVQFVCVELLKGEASGDHAVCLTFKNISRVTLTALEIHFKCKGVDGVILCEDQFEYRDIEVKPGESFGMDDAVFVTQKAITSVDVSLRNVYSGKKVVHLDAIKRGDIAKTAEMYAMGHFTGDFEADFVTLAPYMGLDSISPYLPYAEKQGKGMFVLCRTSNGGAKDFEYEKLADGRHVYDLVGDKLNALGKDYMGEHGYSSIGLVIGGTHIEEATEIRAKYQDSFFLIPGYGAQGGKAEDIAQYLTKGNGGVVNSSRGILLAYKKQPGTAFDEAAYNECVNMKEAIAHACSLL